MNQSEKQRIVVQQVIDLRSEIDAQLFKRGVTLRQPELAVLTNAAASLLVALELRGGVLTYSGRE
jgi:hypothetical protein